MVRDRKGDPLVIATKNEKKKIELQHLLKGLKVRILTLKDFHPTPRIVENGKTFRENAIKKARTIARFTGCLTLADDSGLEVDALRGRPGIYSARFAGSRKSDPANNRKVLDLLRGLPPAKRGAQFVCSVAVYDKHGKVGLAEDIVRGRIAFEPKGSYGFGYDPIFIIPRYGKTFAELGPRVKHRISHRAKALSKARRIIVRYFRESSQNLSG